MFFFFFRFFCKSGPISKGFAFSLPQNWLILQLFRNFCEIGPSSKDFLGPKWGPCPRIFGEKVTHLGGIFPYALTCEYPPGPDAITFGILKKTKHNKTNKKTALYSSFSCSPVYQIVKCFVSATQRVQHSVHVSNTLICKKGNQNQPEPENFAWLLSQVCLQRYFTK